ncbi:MAG: hypothetical protein ACRD1S_08680 [Vicinamibacterales bacterium]
MVRRTLIGFGLALALAGPTFAQDQEAAAQERDKAALTRAQAQEKERQKEQEAADRQALERAKAQEQERRERETGQPINVRVELTIRDQRGTAQPETKTVAIVTADRTNGRVRTGGNVRTEKFGVQDVRLNVDARPIILREGQIRLFVTFEYRPADTEASPSNNISEMLECVLVSGQPLAVTKSADPNSDRSVTVEVKATILK